VDRWGYCASVLFASAGLAVEVSPARGQQVSDPPVEAGPGSVLGGGIVRVRPIGRVTREMLVGVGTRAAPVDADMTLDITAPAPMDEAGVPSRIFATSEEAVGEGFGLRSDCQPAGNCQAGIQTTAYNTTTGSGYTVAEDFVVATGGTIESSCIQGVFWDYDTSSCSDAGTEDWTINFYDSEYGAPKTLIASYTGCTDAGCVPGAGEITMVKDLPSGAPTFYGYPVYRINADFTTGGNTGVAVMAGECYWIEWTATLGASPCGFFWQAGSPGDLYSLQREPPFDYDCCNSVSEDLSLCVDLPLDGTQVLNCDTCYWQTPPILCDEVYYQAALAPGEPRNLTLDPFAPPYENVPSPPGLEGTDLNTNSREWFRFIGTGNRMSLELSSTAFDAVLGVFCGGCENLYGVIGNDNADAGTTDARVELETTDGVEYLVLATSNRYCGSGTLLLQNFGSPGGGTVPSCEPCTLPIEITGTPTVDEAASEPCGSGGINDGCNAGGLANEFKQLFDGDIISGLLWADGGSRDTDWFYVTNSGPDEQYVVWQAEAEYPINLFQIDVGGDITAADCNGLTIPVNDQATRCALATTIRRVPAGDHVLWIGNTVYDHNPCDGDDGIPDSGDEDTAYRARVAMYEPCALPDGPGDDECGAETNAGCGGASDADFEVISLGAQVGGELWADGFTRDTDWYVLPSLPAGNYTISLESEVPTVVFVQDFGTGGLFANCAGATTLASYGVLPCSPVELAFTSATGGNDVVLFVSIGNLDGNGIFTGYPCPGVGEDGLNEYLLTVDSVSVGACRGGFGGCFDACVVTDRASCEANCGVFQGDGSPCPSVPCVGDQTTAGAGSGDPLYGVADGACSAADIQFYVNLFVAADCRADVTTAGAGVGASGFGVQDGAVTSADIQFLVNAYVDCVGSGGVSCSPGGACTE